jgi:hypothetical protein
MFDYSNIRNFATEALKFVAEQEDGPAKKKHVAMTIHGIGCGLDEAECLMAQLGGILDTLQSSELDVDIERISIIERDKSRAKRLKVAAQQYFEETELVEWDGSYLFLQNHQNRQSSSEATTIVEDIKPYALIISMLEDDDAFEDIFYYGIQQPIHSMGLLCERIQIKPNDVKKQQLKRIQNAKIVVCDTTTSPMMNPMLTLHLGCAWGANVPTVLITTQNDDKDLEFDEKNYIRYNNIRELQDRLERWLKERLE